MTNEKQTKVANWTQNALLGIIVVMMGWFMADFGSWKNNIADSLRDNRNQVNKHINDELIKNQDQDIKILNNERDIIQLQQEIKDSKQRLTKGGL